MKSRTRKPTSSPGDSPTLGRRASIRRPIFEIGRIRAALTLGVAGLLTTAIYTLLINDLSTRWFDTHLGIQKGAYCGQVEDGDALDLTQIDGVASRSKELRDHWNVDDPKRLWSRLCATLEQLGEESRSPTNPLQVGVESSEAGTDEENLALLPQHYEPGDHVGMCPTRTQHDRFAWLPVRCLYLRVLGVRPEPTSLALLGIRRPVPQAAVQGTVYLYEPSRVRTEARGSRERRQLRVLQDFDKAVYEAIEVLEQHTARPRWVLRNLNGLFQWSILTCGLWGVLLLAQLWLQAHWQSRAILRGQGLYRQFEKDCEVRPASEVTEQYFRWLSHSSSILVDWILEIVPLLGFIGTVVGMISAMASVGKVVASDPGPELVSAMALVSDNLSLAFSTTFVALAFSIVLYLMRPTVYRVQEMVVDTLPQVLARRQAAEK